MSAKSPTRIPREVQEEIRSVMDAWGPDPGVLWLAAIFYTRGLKIISFNIN